MNTAPVFRTIALDAVLFRGKRVVAMRELPGPDIPLMGHASMRWQLEQA